MSNALWYSSETDLQKTVDKLVHRVQRRVDEAMLDRVADTLADYGYVKVNGNSRWFHLFGTPERAARTLVERLEVGVIEWCNNDCCNCPYEFNPYGCEQVLTLLEWLREEGES